MRMTNKIMQNNSLYNINNNKVLQDQLSTQMSTQKKITRPSDDPVIAIRALRLRSDVSQITQFYEKNAPDADAWLKVTADALGTTTAVIEDMIAQCNTGSNKKNTAEDLDIIVTQLKALRDEFYATGNVDFAGRYVFTGYRTGTTLTYTEDTIQNFTITENMKLSDLDTVNHTSLGDLKGVTGDSYDPVADGAIDEGDVGSKDIRRIRMSYDKLKDGETPSIKYNFTEGNPDGDDLIAPGDIEVMSVSGADNPYEYIQDPVNAGKAVLIPETGELLIGAGLYEDLTTPGAGGTPAVLNENTEFKVSYVKDSWEKGDLRPQHYFTCRDNDKGIGHNENGMSQVIEYDVGYNQQIRVNTTADEVFTPEVNRNIEDLERALADLKEIDQIKKDLDKMLNGMAEGEAGYDNLAASAAAADKAYTSVRENMQKLFEGLITDMQGTLDTTSVAITDNGTRSSRLTLVSNRLMTQKTTFETLQSGNEDADVTEVTVQLKSMEFSYQSALLATGKIMQNSLMNYI